MNMVSCYEMKTRPEFYSRMHNIKRSLENGTIKRISRWDLIAAMSAIVEEFFEESEQL